MAEPKVAGIIPARYASSRLPGKPLALIKGKSMIQRVYEQCRAAKSLDSVYVATDDERIRDAVAAFGGESIMTRPDHASGTDRLAEASAQVDCDIVANIQGDQPFIDPEMIDETVRPLVEDNALGLCTVMYPIAREEDLADPGVVKVVTDKNGMALYFSRSLIPYPQNAIPHKVYEHVGLYVYRKQTLIELSKLPVTILEQVESLEQLRWLEHGYRIRVVETECEDQVFSGFSVDTEEDVHKGEAMLNERGLD